MSIPCFFYCTPCQMQVTDMQSHRERYHRTEPEVVHEVIRWVAYSGPCPRCGGGMVAASNAGEQICRPCGITVQPAMETWTVSAEPGMR